MGGVGLCIIYAALTIGPFRDFASAPHHLGCWPVASFTLRMYREARRVTASVRSRLAFGGLRKGGGTRWFLGRHKCLKR